MERYSYSAYGEVTVHDAAGLSLSQRTEESPWLYHGYYLDAETRLYYCAYRYHDPGTGRWLSRDPLGEGFEGLYEFCRSAPSKYSDQLGLECKFGDLLWDLAMAEMKLRIWKVVLRRVKDQGKKAAAKAALMLIDGPFPVGDALAAIWTIIDVASGGWEVWSHVWKFFDRRDAFLKTVNGYIASGTKKYGKGFLDHKCYCDCLKDKYIRPLINHRVGLVASGKKVTWRNMRKKEKALRDTLMKCWKGCCNQGWPPKKGARK